MSAETSLYIGAHNTWWRNDASDGGKIIPDDIWATEAGRQSGLMDTEYAMHPVYAKMPDGTLLEIVDRAAVVRGAVPDNDAITHGICDSDLSKPEGLEVVSTQYNLVTPRKILEVLDHVSNPALIQDGQAPWYIDTLGLINGGRKLFVSLNMGNETLFGDERERVRWNCFCGSDFTRRGSLYVMATPISVVCQNTWNMAMGKNQGRITIPHHADAEDMFEIAVQMHRRAAVQQDKMRELLEFAATVAVSEDDAEKVIAQMYPLPKQVQNLIDSGVMVSDETRARAQIKGAFLEHSNQLAKNRSLERQLLARSIYERYQDERMGGNSVYTLMGALIDTAQHRPGRGNALNSTLFGERQKEVNRAWEAVQPLLKGGNKIARKTF